MKASDYVYVPEVFNPRGRIPVPIKYGLNEPHSQAGRLE